MELNDSFYFLTVEKLVRRKYFDINDRVLVVCAGALDRDVFKVNGFRDVLITNIEKDRGVQDYAPYSWEFQDVENLTYMDNEFDWVFVHAGLHHCASPHRGVCEMLRVSKKGIGVFEGRDSLLMRSTVRIGLVPPYELEPCVLSDGKDGGMRNLNIPNFVYRWTEKEVIKTVNSYLPQYIHKFYFFYGLRIPTQRLSMSPNIVKRFVGVVGNMTAALFKFIFPKQGNLFAFIITKTGELQPWLEIKNDILTFNMSYVEGKFNPENYRME